jgi:PleD family two-component response regulator
VDDKLDDLRVLGHILKDHGDIIFATTGQTGLFMANKNKPDLIIADFHLQDLPGNAFHERLKELNEAHSFKVIYTSAEKSHESEIEALSAGAIDFFEKPYSSAVVRARVRNHANQSKEQRLLQTLANKDGLTEVYNRRYFEKQSRLELKRHYRQQHPFALALLDIDHFKAYNDAYGHLQGDLCLKEVAQSLNSSSRRPGEFVSRYGGEEFAVVLPNTDLESAKKIWRMDL